MDTLASVASQYTSDNPCNVTIDMTIGADGVSVLTASLSGGGRWDGRPQPPSATTNELRQYTAVRWPFPVKCLFCKDIGGSRTAMRAMVRLRGIPKDVNIVPTVTLSLQLVDGCEIACSNVFIYEVGAFAFNDTTACYEAPVMFRIQKVTKHFAGIEYVVVANVDVDAHHARGKTMPINVTTKIREKPGTTILQELKKRHAEAKALYDQFDAFKMVNINLAGQLREMRNGVRDCISAIEGGADAPEVLLSLKAISEL